ncbi:MAG: nucleotidyltransferase family protein [archaeon]
MKAVILAGGKGTRLRPLTYAIPKPLLPINERPMLEHIILYLKRYGITDIYLTIGYLGYQIKTYFNDGKDLGVNIKYIEEKKPLGTAGCLNLIKDVLDDTFILIGGDNLTTLDLAKFIDFHKKSKSVGTVALFKLENKLEYGIYKLNEDSSVNEFLEKPVFVHLAGTMIFVLEPEIFKFIPENEDQSVINLTDDVIPKVLASGSRFSGYPFDGYWVDVGRLSDYEAAHSHTSFK